MSTEDRLPFVSHEPSSSAPGSLRRAFAALALGAIASLGAGPTTARATEIELRNDSLPSGSTGATIHGYQANSIAAAVFDPDPSYYPIQVKKVQILWSNELFPAGDVSQERAIRFYQGGDESPPNPQLVSSYMNPTLTEGVLNEFDVSSLGITFASGPFAIGVEFADGYDFRKGNLASDLNGCQLGKNIYFQASDQTWYACGLGGDYVIRCIVDASGIPSELACREGNVDTGGGGSPADVLFLDGSAGAPLTREMMVPAGNHTISISKPPAGGSGLYAFWIMDGKPDAGTVSEAVAFDGAGGVQSLGTACRCLPINNHVLPGACPCPTAFPQGFTSKTIFGAAAAANVCLHRAPRDPFAPTSFVRSFPAGEYTILGIIFDPNSSAPGPRKISLTNAIVVTVTP